MKYGECIFRIIIECNIRKKFNIKYCRNRCLWVWDQEEEEEHMDGEDCGEKRLRLQLGHVIGYPQDGVYVFCYILFKVCQV